MALAPHRRGKSVANPGVKPELYCTFFVWVSVGPRSGQERLYDLWPNSANHWLISGTISDGPSCDSSLHRESRRRQENVRNPQEAGNGQQQATRQRTLLNS